MALNTKWPFIFMTGFLDQLEYDNSLKWSSAESALTRRLDTCQAYESAYAKLLSAAGIENAEIRDTYEGHTWNAVKLDDEWYQVDCTWDDTSDNFYGDLDQRHLYFCLTDELMAIAHPGHEKIYNTDDYATRSTNLRNNYFVRCGKANEWMNSYVERIQKHLDAREESFSVDADNQSFPPGISGIQNGIVAFAMNQRMWKTGNNEVSFMATPYLKVYSSSSWSTSFKITAGFKQDNDWVNKEGQNYYYFDDGTMATDWALIDGSWYRFDASGAMLTGWAYSGGKWYYLSESGAMATGQQRINDAMYQFDDNGVLIS